MGEKLSRKFVKIGSRIALATAIAAAPLVVTKSNADSNPNSPHAITTPETQKPILTEPLSQKKQTSEPISPINPDLQKKVKTKILFQGNINDQTGRTILMEPYPSQALPMGIEYTTTQAGEKVPRTANGIINGVRADENGNILISLRDPRETTPKTILTFRIQRGENPTFINIVDPSRLVKGGSPIPFESLPHDLLGSAANLTPEQLLKIINPSDSVFRVEFDQPSQQEINSGIFDAYGLILVRIGGKTQIMEELVSPSPQEANAQKWPFSVYGKRK